jgi:hypothetical protein
MDRPEYDTATKIFSYMRNLLSEIFYLITGSYGIRDLDTGGWGNIVPPILMGNNK